ncbi:hypothetical protein PPTG_13718 [Phytophthora nicotianae INRA-310]|uniref:Uncharacterized protein n=1 Tax=Phytophthora nicotianae (strain INRA-310) TaxID=761204 RepID=W2PZK6_PHYN3|nr:hypothetical protein PPTG_13718 [Phytophthora nicotianae INRA-310]ETN06373.1 hypothetical protein PPTG_13718 [Phytophthora nicotianae INRA-310]
MNAQGCMSDSTRQQIVQRSDWKLRLEREIQRVDRDASPLFCSAAAPKRGVLTGRKTALKAHRHCEFALNPVDYRYTARGQMASGNGDHQRTVAGAVKLASVKLTSPLSTCDLPVQQADDELNRTRQSPRDLVQLRADERSDPRDGCVVTYQVGARFQGHTYKQYVEEEAQQEEWVRQQQH